jgi:ethanolamine utilization microcompartment shell protein EutS
MSVLTHKVGLVLDLGASLKPGHRKLIQQDIATKAGVISADFNEAQGGMLIIEYDPSVTSPTELHQNVREINRAVDVKTVFVTRPSTGEADKTS